MVNHQGVSPPIPYNGKKGWFCVEKAAEKKWILAAAGVLPAISAAATAFWIARRRKRRREAEELAAQIAMLIQ